MLQMSLHLGNLSSRVRKDELERVFQRFGRCNIQVKDKFGFAVYDFPANAEKALRTLRGKNICGEPINVSWSNRQPRPLRRFVRGGRIYESQRARSSMREDYVNRRLGSGSRRDYKMSARQPDADGRRFESVDRGDEGTSYHEENIKDYIGEKDRSFRDDLPEEGRNLEPNLSDNDRWTEQVDHLSNDNGVEDGLQFERYEPYHADDRRDDEDDIYHITCSGGSPAPKKSQEKIGTEQTGDTALNDPENAKSQHTCYICGNLGHRMRNCPLGEASNGKKLSRANRRHDDKFNYRGKGEGELRRPRSKSRGRLQSGRDAVSMRNHKSDRKESSFRKHRRLIRNEHTRLAKETHRSRSEEHRGKKRKQREKGSPARRQTKKARGQESSPIHSYYSASRSRSHSKSASGFSSQSRLQSESSKSGSLSSSPTSDSTSHSSRFGNSKINLKSRSSSPISFSLRVSPGRTLPSSSNKAQIIQKASLVNSASPESKGVLVERGQQLEGDAGSCDYNLDSTRVTMENQSAVTPFEVDEDEDMNESLSDRKDDYHATTRDTHKMDNSCAPGLEQDHLTAGSLSTQALRDMMELENSNVCVDQDHMSISTKNLHAKVSIKSHTSTSITPEEMYKALKHYGMELPEEHVKDLPAEAFFGSARLWPWEIIYYRRLKKGPISIENYAQRVSQNKEFGIVDKYVRSSSGWGELSQDSP